MASVSINKQKVSDAGNPKAAMALKKITHKLNHKTTEIPSKKQQPKKRNSSDEKMEENANNNGKQVDLNESGEAENFSNDKNDDDDMESDLNSDSDFVASSDNDEDYPSLNRKKNKGRNSDGSHDFSKAMNALLDTRLKAYDRKDPILARSKIQLKKFENDKLEQKAKRLLLAEKKARLTSNRNRNLLPTDDSKARDILLKENQFKKISQRGVIKLFNVILQTQTETNKELSKESNNSTKKKELMNEISKKKFLDLVQQAGNN